MKGVSRIDLLSINSLIQAIKQFFRWWWDELVSLMPGAVRQHLQSQEHQLVVSFPDDGMLVTDCKHGQTESSLSITDSSQNTISQDVSAKLARLRKRSGGNVTVKLPHEHVLFLSFPLPSEAEKNLHEVVGYELGRHAPFKIEQVYFDYIIRERRRDEKKLWLSVTVVPKKQVDPLLERVRTLGFVPEVLTVSEAEGDSVAVCNLAGFNLLPKAQQVSARGAINSLTNLLTVSAVLLMIAVSGYPLLMQEIRITDMKSQIDAIKSDATSVISMKQQLEQASEESAYVEDKKQKYPEVLDILNALTTLLPDDTWLEQFEIKGSRLRVLGFSADASSLIERLENSPLLQKVAFDSPIVKDQRTERFRFQIVAELTAREGK